MRTPYPSDITREQFEPIRPMLQSVRKRTRPHKYDLYDIFCGALYILREGCRWRSLPHEYPKWHDVYYHFHTWKDESRNNQTKLDEILSDLVGMDRETQGRNPEPSLLIVDAKTIRNTDTAELKGYDAEKKMSGIKLHLVTDTSGLPHAIHVTTANVTDRNGALAALERCRSDLSVFKLVVDGGYRGVKFAKSVKALVNAEVEVVKRNELHKFIMLPKRWIIERIFGWLEDYRRLWKNCERKLHTTLQMTIASAIRFLQVGQFIGFRTLFIINTSFVILYIIITYKTMFSINFHCFLIAKLNSTSFKRY